MRMRRSMGRKEHTKLEFFANHMTVNLEMLCAFMDGNEEILK